MKVVVGPHCPAATPAGGYSSSLTGDRATAFTGVAVVVPHMPYTVASTADVDSVIDDEYGRMHFLRDPLEAESLGVTVMELEPGAAGKEHDHSHDDQEEVYVVTSGSVTVEMPEETVELGEEEAIRLTPDQTRQLRNEGSEPVRLVLVGAP